MIMLQHLMHETSIPSHAHLLPDLFVVGRHSSKHEQARLPHQLRQERRLIELAARLLTSNTRSLALMGETPPSLQTI